ncbi:MAG TPA: methylated-DNA--[protein]-cysteine S-methyltransferase [Baekduia sp.]|nr:methylated-DNA--[protein]-cysteine S-methyltransferase [Baekduia sp.]
MTTVTTDLVHATMGSPVGELLLAGARRPDGTLALHAVLFAEGRRPVAADPASTRDDDALAPVRAQLGEYFAGARRTFDLELDPHGSPFERAVWHALTEIPYGETESYGALARRVGRPGAARAVGLANGRNPISIVVPCHRVIGADGSLTGYGGGLERKRTLLELEAGVLPLA